MLSLCDPFVDVAAGRWDKISAAYVSDPLTRVSFEGDAKLACSAEEEVKLLEERRNRSQGGGTSTSTEGGAAAAAPPATPHGGYHFVCECFFMTAKVRLLFFFLPI
jgi:hypothetical protein